MKKIIIIIFICVHNFVDIDNCLDLDSLLIQLRPAVTEKWYQFGNAIGVKKELLNKYIQYPPDECLIEVLDNWLRNHAGRPMWKEVAEALDKINLKNLAFDLRRAYETGNNHY